MGIAASANPKETPQIATSLDGVKGKNGVNVSEETKMREEERRMEEERKRIKAELQKKLRSKIRAIANFRKCIRSASVWDLEEKENEGEAENSDDEEEVGEYTEEDGKVLGILYHPRSNREELRDFLWKLKKSAADCWKEIEADECDFTVKYSIHDKELDDNNAVSKDLHTSPMKRITGGFALPPNLDPVDDSVTCNICNKIALFNVACRICTRGFHKKCLKKSGRYNDIEITYIKRADTREGWSCYHCEDISMLLSAADAADMMAEFDQYDINRDEAISLTEFLRFKQIQYNFLDGKNLPEEEEDLLVAQFHRIDTNSNGLLDWGEFVRFESRRYLARMTEEDLTMLLTQKEKLHARDVYLGFTSDKEVQYTYLQSVFLSEGVRTWTDFLRDQALYIIWSRPNRENIRLT